MTKCIFCDILRGDVDVPTTNIEYNNEDYVIIKDIKPASKYHYLAVPKRHIESAKSLTKEDEQLRTVQLTAENIVKIIKKRWGNLLQMFQEKFIFFGLFGVLAFLPYLRSVKYVSKCIFCEIAHGEDPNTKIVYETDDYVIFKDIQPASTFHYLAVPKRHIESVLNLTKENDKLVTNMESGLRKFFTSKGIDLNDALFGFHLPPFISVKHLHMHAIAPKSEMGFMYRMMFKPGTYWFQTPDEIHRYIDEKSVS